MNTLFLCSLAFTVYILFSLALLYVKKKLSNDKATFPIFFTVLIIAFISGLTLMGFALSMN